MRYVCDWVSPECVDPTTVYTWTRAARTKYLCANHGAVVSRQPAMTVSPAGADCFPLAVSTAGNLERVA